MISPVRRLAPSTALRAVPLPQRGRNGGGALSDSVLPRWGRGTMRSMVEGARNRGYDGRAPYATAAAGSARTPV